jgi:putative transposase
LEQFSYEQKLAFVDRNDLELSVRKQCEILGVNRSTLYYEPKEKNPNNIEIKDAIRLAYVKYPFYGHRRVAKLLKRMGFGINSKKVRRLRKELSLRTIYPKPNLSKPKKEHKKYPYLLNGLDIARPNQVWSTDITYIRIKGKGWIYVVAVIDWFSRYILSFEISVSLDIDFCLAALRDALKMGNPEIFNSDQGSQFTSDEFIGILEKQSIRISMDSKGRALDNIRMERFWRSLKYEEVFLKEYETVKEAVAAISAYVAFYNEERIHQSLNYYTPHEIYFGKENVKVKKW